MLTHSLNISNVFKIQCIPTHPPTHIQYFVWHLQVFQKTMIVCLCYLSSPNGGRGNFRFWTKIVTVSLLQDSFVISLCFCSVWWIRTRIDSKVAGVGDLYFMMRCSWAACPNRNLLMPTSTLCWMKITWTVFMAVILYQLKLLKCVIVAADHTFCCIYYHSIVLRTNYFLFVKFVCFIPVFLCLRQSFVLTSFLNVICRHSDCIIPMLFADTVIT